MGKTLLTLLSIFVLMSLAYLPGQDKVNVSGDWEITLITPRGERTSDITFVQEGENLKVTMKDPRGAEISGTGTVKGNEIEWTVTRSTPRGEMTLTYKGKVEGDSMAGQVQMGDFGSADWKAKRKAK